MLSGRVTKERATIVTLLTAVIGLLCVLVCVPCGLISGAWFRFHHPHFPTFAEWPLAPERTPFPTIQPTVRLTAPPTHAPTPAARSTPISIPLEGIVPPGELIEANEMTLAVQGATRPADKIVASASQFNPAPQPGNEYIIIETFIRCLKSESETCLISPLIHFRLVGSGREYPPEILLLHINGLMEGGEFQGGTTMSGGLAFEIDEDETDLTLMYETLLGTERAFLAVP